MHGSYTSGGPMGTNEFLDVEQAAELLGVTRFTISRLIRAGELTT